ncbi:MAG: hypothetical protein A3F63_06720 [Pseudomonadales bacterium RIFCSPHIGHO2_12_FULL_40_16]|nr:MAG: hypothetical protein A2W44_01095 [Acinetobacter sp. RIFCSPHIGHO2_12_41_5]OHC22807.1 MAG: hypothetical protein A3F63_06720 [Pseudomonadales bacterium RIFCSPHIGHO2_12_FULL_40_16]
MTKDELLHEIATYAYATSYGKDKCFATYDIATKTSTRLTVGGVVLGILLLAYQNLNAITALVVTGIIAGVICVYISKYDDKNYLDGALALQEIEKKFKSLYYTVKSCNNNQLSSHIDQMHQLNDEQQKLAFEKHIFGSDWYAHIKIFWTKKINNQWFIKELKLKFFFNKLPISFFVLCLAICILILLLIIGFYIANHLIANGHAQTYLEIFKGICK